MIVYQLELKSKFRYNGLVLENPNKYANIMKKITTLILLIGLLSFSSSALSYTSHATTSCGNLISFENDNDDGGKNFITGWFFGFTTALNLVNNRSLPKFDLDSIWYSLVKYCKENPLDNSFDAALNVSAELYRKTQ
jgi:hypothetical protein